MKPSQLDLTQSNTLPAVKIEAQKVTLENSAKVLPQAEHLEKEDKKKWLVFEDILKTKNDNDPRMDRELKKLSPALREALYEKYESMPNEDRSGRGLIAYLVARDLNSIEDIQFIKKVFQEPPCLSLADCKSTATTDNPHHSATDQTTLVYPQLSALYTIEKQLTENSQLLNNAAYRSETVQTLISAESFPVPVVHEKARSIRNKFSL